MAKVRIQESPAAQMLRGPRSRRARRSRFLLEHLESRLLQSGTPIGVNLEEVKDWSRSLMFVDAMKSARKFGSAAAPWDESATLDANGWPTGDAGTCVITLGQTVAGQTVERIDGTYSFSATGRVNVSPVASEASVANWKYDAATNKTTADIVVRFGATQLFLSFTGAVGGAKDIRLLRPGYAPDSTQTFTNAFLNSLSNVSTLRLMDYLQTNNNPVANWDDRAHVTDATQTSAKGGAWEYAISLANEMHKDLWINIPVLATDDYVHNLAHLLQDTLDPALHVYVEYSNEVWNGSFSQSAANYQAATASESADPNDLNFDHSDNSYYWAWRQVAARLIQVKNDFADVYGSTAMNTTIRPILASQMGWSYVLQNQLEYLEHRFGATLSTQLYGVAGAPYLNIGDLSWSPTLTSDQVLTALGQDLVSNAQGIEKYATMAAYYGVKQLYYEGGVDLTGDVSGNLAAKISANYDPGMTALVQNYLQDATQQGVDLVMFFNLAGAYSWSGTWGLTESINDLSGAKFQGLIAAAHADAGAVTAGFALPAGTATTTLQGGAYNFDMYGSSGNGGVLGGVWGGSAYNYLLNVSAAGHYDVRTSAGHGEGTLELLLDGRDLGTVNVTNSGSSYLLTPPIDMAAGLANDQLSAGLHGLRIKILSGHFDLEGLTFLGGDDAFPAADPTDVQARAVDASSIELSWQPSAGAAGYVIQRSLSGADSWSQVGAVAADALSFTDVGLSVGTSYDYRVRATGLAGDSNFSAAVSGHTLFLTTPILNVQEQGATEILVSWNAVNGATGYTLERSLDEVDWGFLAEMGANQRSFEDGALYGATKYFYRVTAHGPLGASAAQSQGTITDAVLPPDHLQVKAIDGTSLLVSWDPVSEGEQFILERSLNGSSGWTVISQSDTGTLSHLDTGLSAAAVYYYRVKTLSTAGDSDYSPVAATTPAVIVSNRPLPAGNSTTATPPSSAIPAPANVSATATITSARIAWTAVTGAAQYLVERCTDGVTWTSAGVTSGTSLTDVALATDTSYTYRISAVMADGGTSMVSSVASARTARLTATGWSFWWW